MLKLLLSIALYSVASCCNEFAAPVISNLRIPSDHILQKRQVRIGEQHVSAVDYDNPNHNSKVKPQTKKNISIPHNSKYFNEVSVEITSDPEPLPPVDFMPEAEPVNVETDLDIPIKQSIIYDAGLMEILQDLSDCVELKMVQTLRLCPSKRENRKMKHSSRFGKLTDAELESEIKKKCKTVNAILERSAKEIKDSRRTNKPRKYGNDSSENTSDVSLIPWSNGRKSNEQTIGHFFPISPHHNSQVSDTLKDYRKQAVEDIEKSYVEDTANIESNEYLEEDKQAFIGDIEAEQTDESYISLVNQNVLNYSRSPKYDITTINILPIDIGNDFNDSLIPTTEILEQLESDAPISNNYTPEDMSRRNEEDKRPISENIYTDTVPEEYNVESYVTESLQDNEPQVFNLKSYDTENLQDIEPQEFNLESKDTEKPPVVNGRRSNYRPHVNESEDPVIKIITHEYPDGNVVSKVNGTEIEDMSKTKKENKRPILENIYTDILNEEYNGESYVTENLQDVEPQDSNNNLESNITENLPNINGRRGYYRPHVNENEVAMIKIITQEHPDGNVVSKVNGTEIISDDTPTIENYTNIFVKNINVKDNNNVTEVLYKFSIPKHIPSNGELYSEVRTQAKPDIGFIGRLYFLYNKERIPAQFVQESDGNIRVGLDILSLCETENYDSNSVLLKILCKCKNCSSETN